MAGTRTTEEAREVYLRIKNNPIRWANHCAKRKEYKIKNREKILASYRARYAAMRSDPEKWAKNLDRFRRRNSTPEGKILQACRNRLCGIAKGVQYSESTMELCGISVDGLKAHLESKFQPGMTWQNYGPFWHIDHIKPCCSFDVSDIKQLRACFHYTNLQPLWAFDNLSKGSKIIP